MELPKEYAILKSAKDSIILANEKGEMIFWNPYAEKTFGFKENEVYGKSLNFIMPARHRVPHQQRFEQHISTSPDSGKGNRRESCGLKKNGKEFPIELSVSHWKNGNQKYFCWIIRDISEKKNNEDEQRKCFTQLSDIAFLFSGDLQHRLENEK